MHCNHIIILNKYIAELINKEPKNKVIGCDYLSKLYNKYLDHCKDDIKFYDFINLLKLNNLITITENINYFTFNHLK